MQMSSQRLLGGRGKRAGRTISDKVTCDGLRLVVDVICRNQEDGLMQLPVMLASA